MRPSAAEASANKITATTARLTIWAVYASGAAGVVCALRKARTRRCTRVRVEGFCKTETANHSGDEHAGRFKGGQLYRANCTGCTGEHSCTRVWVKWTRKGMPPSELQWVANDEKNDNGKPVAD